MAFVHIYLLSCTRVRRFTLQIANLLRMYTLLHCFYSPPAALLPTHTSTFTQPSFSPQAHTHPPSLLFHTHRFTLLPLPHTANPRFTALSHFPPSLRHSVTLWYTHTFPLNTDLSLYPSLSHRYIITHRTLPLLCTVRPLPPLLHHTVAITRPPSHSLPHPSAPSPSAWSHTQLHCCTLTHPLCNTHAVPPRPSRCLSPPSRGGRRRRR